MFANWGGSIGSSGKASFQVDEEDDNVDIPLGIAETEMVAHAESEGSQGQHRGLGVDSSGPLHGVVPLPVILSNCENPPSQFKDVGRMRMLQMQYNIPDSVSPHAPDEHLRACYHVPNMVCMYEFPFEQGLRLPLPQVVVDFCDHHHLAPAQLMPNTWRVLLSLQVLSDSTNCDVGIYNVIHSYHEKKVSTDVGRYQLQKRRDMDPPIVGIKDGERFWRDKYFFTSSDTLGVPPGKNVPTMWSIASEFRGDRVV